MAKKTPKTTPIITHTEILSRAIRSIEADIDEWRRQCESLPQPHKDGAFEISTKELRAKLDTLKTLYSIETGADYDV